MSVDAGAFDRLMAEQKERAKAAWKGSGEVDIAGRFASLLEDGLESQFVGYDGLEAHSRIISLLDEGAGATDGVREGKKGYLVTGQTPFYGESGGQTGDLGSIHTATGTAMVLDTLKPSSKLIVHHVEVVDGEILLDQEAELKVGSEERLAVARNHTSTHLLHAALRRTLGGHVQQAGSLVSPTRLRFDFTHISAITPEELAEVENDVNRMILADTPLTVGLYTMEQAKKKGAIGLFEDKYGDEVRVVEVPGESMELCGGTHLERTGQAGLFHYSV
jgi:alanyl-tRNA synthetase (EC 6.1.1.7)